MSSLLTRFAPKIVKVKFTPEEDEKLRKLVGESVDIDWGKIAAQLPNRNQRQCRERWQNYLNPSLSTREWTQVEDDMVVEKFNEYGPHWNVIARLFNGRSGNAVRNRYLVIMRHQQKKKRIEELMKARQAKKQAQQQQQQQTQQQQQIQPRPLPEPILGTSDRIMEKVFPADLYENLFDLPEEFNFVDPFIF